VVKTIARNELMISLAVAIITYWPLLVLLLVLLVGLAVLLVWLAPKFFKKVGTFAAYLFWPAVALAVCLYVYVLSSHFR
jgi:hypothetical protein